MTRHFWVLAAALASVPLAGAGATDILPSVESGPAAQASHGAGPGFEGFLQDKLAQLAATLNAESNHLGLNLEGTRMETLLGWLSGGNEGRLEDRIDHLKRSSAGLRYHGGEPQKEREFELRVPLHGGAALTSGYEASRLDVGLGSTDGDVAHEFRIGASLRF